MPILEYECPFGHITEEFFTTISAGEKVDRIPCEDCADAPTYILHNDLPVNTKAKVIMAEKIFSRPVGFGLYGNPAGYDKPSTTKRFTTKTVNREGGNANT